MPSEITMPQLSDTMAEGTVVKWHKKEGEAVKAGEELADIETDKATMPMESFEAGTLAYIAAPEGQKVKVGGLVAVIAMPGEDPAQVKREAQGGAPAAAPPQAAAPAAPAKTPAPAPVADIDEGAAPIERQFAQARREMTAVAEGPKRAPVAAGAAPAAPHPGEPLRASPLARRIAEDKGVDLQQIQGSGPNGRIVERDVLAFLEGGPAVAAPAPRTPPAAPAPAAEAKPLAPVLLTGEKKVIPMSKMRTAIATALQRSKQLVPHFYEKVDIDLEAVMTLRQRLNEKLEKENVRLSVADFITKAVATCLLQYPVLNARFNAEKNEITQYGDVNMGIAVAIPDGLIVPVLRGVNQMGLKEIRIRSVDLIERARAQRLRREEQSEATFTISSLGSFGIREFSAIINPPEVGILAVGSAQKQPVVVGNQIVPRTLLTVVLSADHRVVDGASAAEFLTALKATLEEPGMMLV